jgi:hypothetical protein
MTEATSAAPSRSRLLSFGIGVGGGILGLVPWLIGGGTLPLQNLWATETMPDAMPFVLLPLSQYSAVLLFALVLIGGVFAGVAVHVVARRRTVVAWPASVGVLLVHLIAAVQSFAVLGEGLGLGGGDSRALIYFAGMLAGTVAAAVMAQVGFWMTSRRSVGIAALGIALAAVPFGNWFTRSFVALTGEASAPVILSDVGRWLPAVVVGGALVWCGIRPLSRLVVWVVSLLALWVLPALFGALQYGLGMRVLDGDVVEMARASAQVFPLMLEVGWLPVGVALVIAVVGTIVRMVVERDRTDAAPEQRDADRGY